MAGGVSNWKENRLIRTAFRRHSRTFSTASLLLPRTVRLPVATLYLYCRTVDTIADERVLEVGADRAQAELDAFRSALDRALVGRPSDDLLWRHLAEVHERFGLLPAPMYELIEGARWDLERKPIRDEGDLLAYSNLVAGSVGAMMLPFLTGSRGEMDRLEPYARALGNAMQVTNICRDVGEDWQKLRRVYVPESWCAESGIRVDALDPAALPVAWPLLMERMMSLAEGLYADSLPGLARLGKPVRTGIGAALRMYRDILNEVRARGYDNIGRRAFVPAVRKLRVIWRDDYASRKRKMLRGYRIESEQ